MALCTQKKLKVTTANADKSANALVKRRVEKRGLCLQTQLNKSAVYPPNRIITTIICNDSNLPDAGIFNISQVSIWVKVDDVDENRNHNKMGENDSVIVTVKDLTNNRIEYTYTFWISAVIYPKAEWKQVFVSSSIQFHYAPTSNNKKSRSEENPLS